MVKPEHALGGFTIFALMLNFDRVVSGDRIFNGNAVLCMILFSYFLNYLRMGMQSGGGITATIYLWWTGVSLCFLLEPIKLRPIIGLEGWGKTARVDPSPSCWNLRRVFPSLLNTLSIGMMACTHMAEETGSFKVARSLSFAVLCITWVYVVGVWQRCMQGQQGIFTQNLLARFTPTLFGPPLMSVGYVFVCMVALVYLYVEIHGGGFKPWSYQTVSPIPAHSGPPRPQENIPEEPKRQDARLGGIEEESDYWEEQEADLQSPITAPQEQQEEEDLEACFRAACMARGK